ncbi:hypothetical protein Cgig2_019637 [Carnegiea gigantea]|uniref:DYW domain-containing protein n=1 Tax=Carnegiea gigantea TaxID=171969 RepID=A0A9Q1QKS4_9CARY|nr:hypothetical protein Cgig2_019637 [Carnegiea gigantea]
MSTPAASSRLSASTLRKICFQNNANPHIHHPQSFCSPTTGECQSILESRFVSLLHGCTDLPQLKQVHAHIYRWGFDQNCFVITKLIRILTKLNSPMHGYPHKVFDQVHYPNPFLWTALIRGYVLNGPVSESVALYSRMRREGVRFVSFTFSALLKGCTAMGDVDLGAQFHAQNARPKEALELFERMQSLGIQADEFTLVSVTSACSQLGTTKYATWICDVAERTGNGPERNVVIGSALIDMYAKCGKVDAAHEIFKVMTERNVYTYSSMIMGFAVHSHFDAAMQLFYEMETMDIKPNKVTFVGLLTACSHAGKVDEGRRLFGIMEESYGVAPTADHYTCMVDLLGRSGHLDEALDLIKSMPLDPHGALWGALLGACSIHNNPDIAEIAAGNLFELEPNSIGNYVLLCNILASAGRWDSVSRVRKLMRKKGLQKNPACSWVEQNKGNVHKFFAGDLTHPRLQEIRQLLEDLLTKLRLHGYQPNLESVSYDISDDDKRLILMSHSEKLALGFGLLTIDSEDTIRIMKNLRICEDCHIFMCGASMVTGREIIVRDNMRFHHFHNGKCSCGNFWLRCLWGEHFLLVWFAKDLVQRSNCCQVSTSLFSSSLFHYNLLLKYRPLYWTKEERNKGSLKSALRLGSQAHFDARWIPKSEEGSMRLMKPILTRTYIQSPVPYKAYTCQLNFPKQATIHLYSHVLSVQTLGASNAL